MKLNRNLIYPATMILALGALLPIWADPLTIKQMGFLGFKYEILKILFFSTAGYLIAKFTVKKVSTLRQFKSISSKTMFLVVFLIINSYIISQYLYNSISNRLVKHEIRTELNTKTHKLGPSGWGYESSNLSYAEFKELTKNTNLPDIPNSARNIYVDDWYEFDYRRIIRFDLDSSINLNQFYGSDSVTLKYIEKLRFDYDEKSQKPIDLDTSALARYKWEASEI